MSGTGTTTALSGTTFSGSGDRSLKNGRSLVLYGTSAWAGTGGFVTSGSITITVTNNGTFDIQNDESFDQSGTTQPVFNNFGTLIKTAGTGTSEIEGQFNNTGPGASVVVQTGKLVLGGGTSDRPFDATGAALEFAGAHTLLAGATVTGAHISFVSNATKTVDDSFEATESTTVNGSGGLIVELNGPVLGVGDLLVDGGTIHFNSGPIAAQDVTLNGGGTADLPVGDSTAAALAIAGGTLSGAGGLTVAGASTWTSGGMTEMGTTTFYDTLTISSSSTKTLKDGRSLTLNGATTWTGTGNISYSGATPVTMTNNGDFDIQNDATFADGGAGAPTIINNGMMTKSAGTGTTTFQAAFTNAGTVESRSGLFRVAGADTQTVGQTILNGGNVQSTSAISIQDGTLEGFGTLTANVTSDGTVSPGLSAGTLAITGNYTQNAGGEFRVELGRYTQGSEFDLLAVSATASLDGTLLVELIDGFTPLVGDQFVVLTAGTRNGTFASVVTEPSGLAVDVIYAAQSVTVEIADVPPPVECATCPGDVTGDSLFDADDIQPFVDCLLLGGPACGCADMDGGGLTLDDVALFVTALLNSATCP